MKKEKKLPRISLCVLGLIILSSVFAGVLAPYSMEEMNPAAINLAPSAAHIFGTDSMGRDLFTMVLYGGRASIYIGLLSACISTAVAVVYGTVSGLAGERLDDLLMRFSELIMSVPSILLVIFLQAMWGKASYTSLSVIIGLTGWMNISKIVRSEVRQIRNSDYVLAARTMEGGFWYILRRHLLPNFISSIMFMVVTNIGSAIGTESTLSFLGIGLPIETVSWGSMLSQADRALLSNNWWLILIPGLFLVVTLVCITNIGHYIRKANHRRCSNL